MDQVQIARQKMIETVSEFLQERPTLRQANLAVAEEAEHLVSVQDLLEELSGAQGRPLTGITEDKAKVRQELEKAIVTCSSQLYGHGARTRNETLRHEFDCRPSDIQRLSDVDLRTMARRTLEAVQIHQAGLEACGHTAAHREALTLHNNRFRGLIRAPRKAVTGRADVTQEVARTIDEATDRLREQLDPLMQQYWGTDRPLYDAYRKARRLTDLPRQKLTDEEKAQAKERAKKRQEERKAKALAKKQAAAAPAAAPAPAASQTAAAESDPAPSSTDAASRVGSEPAVASPAPGPTANGSVGLAG
jgi:hypothetical protein